MDLLTPLFSSAALMPQGYGYLWLPSLVWLHAISDLIIGATCVVISFTLVRFHRRRPDIAFRWIFLAFALFIVVCGAAHLVDTWTLWVPSYWLQGGVKAVTAALSLVAAFALIRIMPDAMTMPSPATLQAEVLECRRVEADLQGVNDDPLVRGGRKAMEIALRESEAKFATSEARFSSVFRATPEALAISTEDNATYLDVNPAYERVFGYRREEVVGKTSLALSIWVDPEDRVRVLRRLHDEGRVTGMSLRFRRKGGEVRFGQLSAERIELEGGACLVVAMRDVTERVRGEDALRKSEEKFSTVFRTCPEAITIATLADGTYLDVNDAFERLYGVPRIEAIGSSSVALDLWVDPGRRDELVRQLEQNRRVTGFPNLIRHRSGEIKVSEISAERIEVGGLPCLIAVVRDVTDRKRAEDEVLRLNAELEQRVNQRTAELEVVNQELESFSYSVSHDLRAPLRSIHGFSQALLDDCGAQISATGRHHLDRVQGAAQRMGQLIDDLLQLSHVTRTEMVRQPVDLAALARDVVQDLRSGDPGRVVDVVVHDGLQSTGDPRLLRVVLENLLGNAWKFTSRRDGARIEFGLKPGPGRVFCLQDNGAGFDMAFAPKLFGAFQRLHGAKEFPGTGVGLATVHRIVRRHGGTIWAEAAIDRGAAFYFTLGESSSILEHQA